MKKPAGRFLVEWISWGLGTTGVILLVASGRRDDWLFLLVLVGGVTMLVRIVVWFARLAALDNRFSAQHENAIWWTIAPIILVVLWTTVPVNWWTVVLTVGIAITALQRLFESRAFDGGPAEGPS